MWYISILTWYLICTVRVVSSHSSLLSLAIFWFAVSVQRYSRILLGRHCNIRLLIRAPDIWSKSNTAHCLGTRNSTSHVKLLPNLVESLSQFSRISQSCFCFTNALSKVNMALITVLQLKLSCNLSYCTRTLNDVPMQRRASCCARRGWGATSSTFSEARVPSY